MEQREVLAQCYEERRSLASERAELSLLQKRALEREQRESKKSIQVGPYWLLTLYDVMGVCKRRYPMEKTHETLHVFVNFKHEKRACFHVNFPF